MRRTLGAPGSVEEARPERGVAGEPSHGSGSARARRLRDEPPDEALLRTVYEDHGQALMAYATRLLHDRDAAADVVQEAFLRAWRNPEVLTRGHGPVRGWLLVVAKNIVIDRVRAAQVRPQEVSDLAMASGAVAAEPDHADRVTSAVAVAEAVAGLSDDHREVLEQLYFLDRTLADAAVGIGISVGTVKSRAHYAICALRKALGRGDGR